MTSVKLIPEGKIKNYITNIFLKIGINHDDATFMASHLVTADMKGIHSHGISRTKVYIERFEKNLISNTSYTIERDFPAVTLINGQNNFGIINAFKGLNIAMEKAEENGIAVVGVNKSNHCGALSYYIEYAAAKGYISLVTTNAPATMTPHGGIERFHGTNPISYGIPSPLETPIVFDMATSIAAKGKITYALKNNQKIPFGWALTETGEKTNDPEKALSGIVLPVGGPKGSFCRYIIGYLYKGFICTRYRGIKRLYTKAKCRSFYLCYER